MNIDLKKISPAISDLTKKGRRYAGFIFVIAALLVYSVLVFRISQLVNATPTDEGTQALIKRLKVDENSLNKMQELEDQNIQTKSLFKDARDNPFKDQ